MTVVNHGHVGQTNRGWRRLLSNVALAAVAAFFAFALAEILLRFLGLGRAPVLLSQDSPGFFVHSKVVGLSYEIRPDFVGRAFGAEVRINSHGMRSPERPIAKPKGVRRVLILGDSVAFGHGVEQAAMFSALLEDSLSDGTTKGMQVEVINASVPGYNSEQQWLFLREKGFAWQPDVVLLVAVINDVEPIYELTNEGGLAWKNPPELYRDILENEIVGRGMGGFLRNHVRVFGLLDHALRQPYLLTKRYLDYLGSLYVADSAGWRAAQKAICAMHVMCQARGIGFVLAYCPVPAQPEPAVFRQIRGQYSAFAQREGITFVDLYDAENSRPVKRVTISSLDRHPSILGHKLIADALRPLVAREISQARPAPFLNDER